MKFKLATTKLVSFKHQKELLAKVGKVTLIASASVSAYILYTHYFHSQIGLHYMKNDLNDEIVNSVDEIKNPTYDKSLIFPFRFMEIIYGNIWDQRDFVEYEREIIHCKDGEHIAVGSLKRLDFTSGIGKTGQIYLE
jgi:hypothetical protein